MFIKAQELLTVLLTPVFKFHLPFVIGSILLRCFVSEKGFSIRKSGKSRKTGSWFGKFLVAIRRFSTVRSLLYAGGGWGSALETSVLVSSPSSSAVLVSFRTGAVCHFFVLTEKK